MSSTERIVFVAWRAAPALIALGCAGRGHTGDELSAGEDDATIPVDREDSAKPATDGGSGACAPIVGAASFGVLVRGSLTLDAPDARPGPSEVEAMLLFPKGRVAGAPVILARAAAPYFRGFQSSRRILDDALGATGLKVVDGCQDAIDATLLPSTDGLLAKVTFNSSAPWSDALDLHTGHATLCARGDLPSSSTLKVPSGLGQLSVSTFEASLPLDPATVSTIKAFAGGGEVPLWTDERNGLASVAPYMAYPVTVTSITFDVSRLRDVLGRPFDPVAPVRVGAPSGSVMDRSFDTAPPATAISSSIAPVVKGGALWFDMAGTPSSTPRSGSAVIAFGSEPGAKTLRIRHRFDCSEDSSYGPARTAKITLASADGRVIASTVGCSSSFVDETLTLPGAQPTYLYVEWPDLSPRPCNYPFGPKLASYVLDDLAFSP